MTTTVAVGSVSVSTSGTLTNQLLQQFASVSFAGGTVSIPSLGAGASIPGTTVAGTELYISPTVSGTISVGSGYQVIIYNGTGTLVGGDSTTAIIGDLNYSGGAGTVIGTGTQSGTVVDTAPGATFAMATGNELVFGLADGQTFRFDSGYSTLVSGGTVQGSGSTQSVSVDGSASVIGFYVGSTNFTQTGGFETMYAGPGGNTLMASAGNTVFFGSNAGDAVTLGSGNAEVFNGSGTGTITAGSGADTIFAQGLSVGSGGVIYTGGTGSSFFIGGPGTSTVYTAANETAFGGSGGDVVSVASGSKLLFIGGGAADSISGGTVAPTVWGYTNENMTVADSVQGGIYILYGNNDKMDLTNTGGASHILALDGAPFGGNATLTMSNAGNDSLVLFSADQFGMTHSTHTLTIANWQASDMLDMTFATVNNTNFGFSTADTASAQAALATGSSFTLADGTTVVFQGAKPTTIAHI